MKKGKICPILKAGTMLTRIHTETGRTTVHDIYSDFPNCMGEDCEWYYRGCPAHPMNPKIIEEIEARHKNST